MTEVCVLLKQTREPMPPCDAEVLLNCLFCSLLRLAEFEDVVWKLFVVFLKQSLETVCDARGIVARSV